MDKWRSADRSLQDFGLRSKNPLLQNITDYLIEEANAEEEELLGIASTAADDADRKIPMERDEALLKVRLPLVRRRCPNR